MTDPATLSERPADGSGEAVDEHVHDAEQCFGCAEVHERALAEQDATPSGLDVLRRAVEAWTPQHSSACAAQDDDADCICGTSDVYAAALAVATPTGLDVERLHAAMLHHWSVTMGNRLHVCVGGTGSCAEDIAAEYDRLAATEAEG